MAENLLTTLRSLITELRNRRDVTRNFRRFHALVSEYQNEILSVWDLRWMVSICDTYADYGNAVERRNALLVSLFVNMVRLSDTYALTTTQEPDETMIMLLRQQHRPLPGGLTTLSLASQDTLLNLAKRLECVLEETPFFQKVYRKAVETFLDNDALLGNFARVSDRPEYVFPKHAEVRPDNYGVV